MLLIGSFRNNGGNGDYYDQKHYHVHEHIHHEGRIGGHWGSKTRSDHPRSIPSYNIKSNPSFVEATFVFPNSKNGTGGHLGGHFPPPGFPYPQYVSQGLNDLAVVVGGRTRKGRENDLKARDGVKLEARSGEITPENKENVAKNNGLIPEVSEKEGNDKAGKV